MLSGADGPKGGIKRKRILGSGTIDDPSSDRSSAENFTFQPFKVMLSTGYLILYRRMANVNIQLKVMFEDKLIVATFLVKPPRLGEWKQIMKEPQFQDIQGNGGVVPDSVFYDALDLMRPESFEIRTVCPDNLIMTAVQSFETNEFKGLFFRLRRNDMIIL